MKKCATISFLFLFACGGNSTPPSGQPSTIASQRQATVAECPNGGVVIEYGIDDDGDGQLDPNEVDGSEVVCHGADGRDSLISVDVEPPGANCPAGGSAMKTGLDLDGDGVLDPTEVTSTTYVCTNAASLVETSEASECPNGGTVIESGLDSDGDGVLDQEEVTSTEVICDGIDGTDGSTGAVGLTSLIAFREDTTTSTCPDGGTAVDTGLDLDGDGILDPSEITSTSYLCDGTDGTNGSTGARSLLEIRSGASGCPTGGVVVEAGVDLDGDGVLDPGEVESTANICNGTSGSTGAVGLSSLIEVTTENPGASCPNGGSRISAGVDLDGDGALDPTEITSIAFACTGTDGSIVVEDASSLVEITDELAGVNCPYGGVQVSAGLDANGNGVLDPGEITSTEYVCDGNLTGPTGVFVGNYTITNPFEAAYIARVTEITGDLLIEQEGVTSLVSLPLLTRVGGQLRVYATDELQTLELVSLTEVGGNFGISIAEQLSTLDAPNLATIGGGVGLYRCGLTNLNGLRGLVSIDSFGASDCGDLASLTGLEGITSVGGVRIDNCDRLVDFTGLDNLTSIAGDLDVSNNSRLTGFVGLQGVTSVAGRVYLFNNAQIANFTNFNASIGADLIIMNNTRLTSLAGLETLVSLVGDLTINANHGLTSLAGLVNLRSVDRLEIRTNNTLANLGMSSLTTATHIEIVANPVLPTCQATNLVNQCVPTPTSDIRSNGSGTCP